MSIKNFIRKEIEPYEIRNRERSHKRHLNNTLFDYKEQYKNRYSSSGSRSLIVLVKAGIPYKEACQLLNKTY